MSAYEKNVVLSDRIRRALGIELSSEQAGALRRVGKLCASVGLHFFHQGDPRGCALYVAREELNESNYNRGICCPV